MTKPTITTVNALLFSLQYFLLCVCVCVTKPEPHVVSVFVFSADGNFDPQGTLSNVW